MTAGPLPVLRPGMTLQNMSASEFNTAMDILRAVSNFKVGPGLELDYTPGVQMSVKLSHVPQPVVSQEITVILREEPAEGAVTMTVFEVAYLSIPPVPCLTEEQQNCGARIIERELEAYPDFGLTPSDFDEFVTTDVKAGPFLKAYHREGTWRVMLPGEGGGRASRFVKVISVNPGTAFLVMVQFLKFSEEPGHQNELIPDGDPKNVFTWPDRINRHYAGLAGRPDILQAITISGGWYLIWKANFEVTEPDPTLPTGRCT